MNDNLQVIPPQQSGPMSSYDAAIPVESYSVPPSGFRLDKFLTAPGKLVPGTRMVIAVTDAGQRKALVAWLAKQK